MSDELVNLPGEPANPLDKSANPPDELFNLPDEPINPSDFLTNAPRRGRQVDPSKSPLAYIMYRKGWTVDALAKASGMNLEQLRRYANGQLRIHPKHLQSIARALWVDPQLIDYIPPPQQRKEIDYDAQLEEAWRKIKLGVDPQVVLEEFETSQQFFGLVKRFIRMLVKINEEFNEVFAEKKDLPSGSQ